MAKRDDSAMQETKEKELVQQARELEITKVVAGYLRDLGMPLHLRGYRYAREAIVMSVISNEKVYMITKELYPEIAKKYKTGSSCIERSMRSAIEVGWKRADSEAVKKIFGYSNAQRKRPTNAEFVAQIADYICINNQI